MVKIGPPGPKVNTLDIDPTLAYADTSSETCWIIGFFLKGLRPVEIAGLEPEDRNCPICAEDYRIDFHRAVRLPCNHCSENHALPNGLVLSYHGRKVKD